MIMARAIIGVFRRDLLVAMRHPTDILSGLVFFVMIISLLPLAIGPSGDTLSKIAPQMIWVAVMLATMPQMDRFYTQDAGDGVLEQFLISSAPLPLLIFAKVLAGWLAVGIPLILATPLMALMLGLAAEILPILLASVTLGSFCLMLIGALASAFTLGSRRSAILTAILVLPFAIPVLIFGAAAISDAQGGGLALLGAMTLFLTALVPPASATALRFTEE